MIISPNNDLAKVADRGSVFVMGDGAKTYTDLLNELYVLIDVNKISHQSRLRLANAYISISQIANYFVFDEMVDFMVTGKIFAYSIYLNNNDSVFMETEISTSTVFTNHSPEVAPYGQVIRLYY